MWLSVFKFRYMILCILDILGLFEGKCVIVCCDFNVFLWDGIIMDDGCVCVLLLIFNVFINVGVCVVVCLYFG